MLKQYFAPKSPIIVSSFVKPNDSSVVQKLKIHQFSSPIKSYLSYWLFKYTFFLLFSNSDTYRYESFKNSFSFFPVRIIYRPLNVLKVKHYFFFFVIRTEKNC